MESTNTTAKSGSFSRSKPQSTGQPTRRALPSSLKGAKRRSGQKSNSSSTQGSVTIMGLDAMPSTKPANIVR